MLPHLFAYLDLASGSMIVQAAIAGVVAVPILFRNQIRRLLGRGATTEDVTLEDAAASGTESSADVRLDGSETSRP